MGARSATQFATSEFSELESTMMSHTVKLPFKRGLDLPPGPPHMSS